MNSKIVELPDVGKVYLYKRRGNRNIKISITNEGKVRVTLPYWAPYHVAAAFVQSKKEWITQHQQKNKVVLSDGAAIGKAHRLVFAQDSSLSTPRSRLVGNEIRISHPPELTSNAPEVQKLAKTACYKALQKQAATLLPQRLEILAAQHDFSYKAVSVRRMKSRWGSCDSHTNISLNIFLVQLPWDYIDYVLLHELSHTKAMHHGQEFWDVFESCLPTAKQYRKNMRNYKAYLNPL